MLAGSRFAARPKTVVFKFRAGKYKPTANSLVVGSESLKVSKIRLTVSSQPETRGAQSYPYDYNDANSNFAPAVWHEYSAFELTQGRPYHVGSAASNANLVLVHSIFRSASLRVSGRIGGVQDCGTIFRWIDE
jgi:hypothetical protein